MLVCALPEHTHTESCYPQTLPEPTVPAEKQKETAPEEITAETTAPAPNGDGNGSPKETAENTESLLRKRLRRQRNLLLQKRLRKQRNLP